MGISRIEAQKTKLSPRTTLHPCQQCGACCAKWRVQFYWREAEKSDSSHPVPSGFFEELSDQMRAMQGTTAKHRPRCVALSGRIGEEVGCRIYESRPSPCRAFAASFEDGKKNPRCDEARIAHGLKPLTLADWGGEIPNSQIPQQDSLGLEESRT